MLISTQQCIVYAVLPSSQRYECLLPLDYAFKHIEIEHVLIYPGLTLRTGRGNLVRNGMYIYNYVNNFLYQSHIMMLLLSNINTKQTKANVI